MSYLHDERDEEHLDRTPRERELTLSTGTILGIFFGLALLCGAFFAFGYNMGSKARPTSVVTAEGLPPTADFNTFKPSSGTPAVQPVPGGMSQKEADATNRAAANTSSVPLAVPGLGPVAPPPHPAHSATNPAAAYTMPEDTTPVSQTSSTRPTPAVHLATPSPAAPQTPAATGSFMVQVAAVSHQEDADLLMGALRRKGYAVVARNEPQDRLTHIQVGPFSSKKDADAMRQRLLTDGYNAIVK